MTDWFRTWHGAPSDPKWRLVAKRASVRPGDVWAVVSYLFDRASQATDRGSVAGHDAELIAEVFGYDTAEVERIIIALTDKGVIVAGRLTAWDKYQPKREDGAAERAKVWREQQRTQPNATERNRTLDTEKTRTEAESKSRGRGTNPIIVLQSEVDPITAQRWVTHCEDKGKRPSAAQAEELCAVLREVRNLGGNPAEALKVGIKRGWVSLEVEWLRKHEFPMKTAGPALAEDWPARLKVWNEDRTWSPAWGPNPDDPKCRAPAELRAAA